MKTKKPGMTGFSDEEQNELQLKHRTIMIWVLLPNCFIMSFSRSMMQS